MGHAGADNDDDEHTGQNEEPPEVVQLREEAVHEQDDRAAQPCADDETDENMPCLHLKSGVHKRIHRDSLLSEDGRHRGAAQDPGQAVPPAREETADAAVFAGSDRSPVVD